MLFGIKVKINLRKEVHCGNGKKANLASSFASTIGNTSLTSICFYASVVILVSISQCNCDVFMCFHSAGNIEVISNTLTCRTVHILPTSTRLQQWFSWGKMCYIYSRNLSLEAELQISFCKGHVCVLLPVQGRHCMPEHKLL